MFTTRKVGFVIEYDRFARSICVNSDMTFYELEAAVAGEFHVDANAWITNLSYWLPKQLSIFSTSKKPPVALNSTFAPKGFLLVKDTKAHLNFCHSIEPSVGGDIQKFDGRELGESFGTAKYIQRELESVRVESQVVQFVTAPTIETNGDVDDGAGKYFSSEVEGVHVELAVVKSVSAPTTETNGEAVDGVEEWLFRGIRRHDKALWTEPAYDVCHDLDMAGL
ncbi:unnamed protein product [Arabidopsis thaliana]|uniref:(thale cress) hypothetical protein n=1 Tax=Arabidopsis thaliana TaxID=3702 RepID=A0A7G2E5S0_ARATH|nr:unnamed protein product [Arabidopsis thaliana]